MKARKIRLAIVATAIATVGLVAFEALPAAAAVTEVATEMSVSAPTKVVKRSSVTFSGRLTSTNPECVANVTITVTKPTPGSWQVARRNVISTDASGNFTYTKKIYFSGEWTFSFQGRTLTSGADTMVCQSSTAVLQMRATKPR